MDQQLYLQPPTFAEFIYSGQTLLYGPETAYENVALNASQNPLYNRRFEFPESVRRDDLTNEKLEQLIQSFTHTTQHTPRIDASLLTVDLFSQLFEYLSPQATLKHEAGECKAFAVFAVTGKRLLGRASRFYTPRPKHIIIEELYNGDWIPKDPHESSSYLNTLDLDDPMTRLVLEVRHGITKRDPKFDFYYDKLLKDAQ